MSANYVLLATFETKALTNYVTFSNIPQTGYTDLKLVMSGRDSGDDLVRFSMAFNTQSKQTFTRRVLYGVGNGISTSTMSTNTSIGFGTVRNTGTANTYGNCEIYIPNYSSTTLAKTFLQDGVEENNSTDAIMSIGAGSTTDTAPIKSISIFADAPYLAIGSTFSLFGLASENSITIAPKATGGDIIANDGEYWYHAFLTTGAFKPITNMSCDYLVIAGGGGGGPQVGGGGGAGGLRVNSSVFLSPASYTVTVGSGGASAGAYSITGYSGGTSSFNSFAASGGGGGGYHASVASNGVAGGSGGGGGGGNSGSPTGGAGNAGNYSPVEGYAGGAGTGGGTYSAGGGGGAGGVGSAGSGSNGGAGGVGSNTYSAWSYATNTGVAGYYAGGGGGCSNTGSVGGLGGLGGGGNGSAASSAGGTSGVANTGGGGGGYRDGNGGNGGSGIVIVRYAMA